MTEHSGYKDGYTPPGARREPYLKLALASLAGPLCWVLHFSLVYLLEGFLCIQDSAPVQLIIGTIALATLVSGTVCAWLMIKSSYWLCKAGATQVAARDFLVYLNRVLAGLALLAIVWSGMGAAFLSPCSGAY